VQQRWRRLARGLRENQSQQTAAEEWAGATDPYLPPPQQAMDPMGKGPAEYFGGKYLDEDSLPPDHDPGGPQGRLSDGGGVGLLASNRRPAADDDDDDDDIEEPSEGSDHAVKGFPSNKRSGKWPISTPAPATIPIRTRPTVNRTLVPLHASFADLNATEMFAPLPELYGPSHSLPFVAVPPPPAIGPYAPLTDANGKPVTSSARVSSHF
jgi:hypothetical protein